MRVDVDGSRDDRFFVLARRQQYFDAGQDLAARGGRTYRSRGRSAKSFPLRASEADTGIRSHHGERTSFLPIGRSSPKRPALTCAITRVEPEPLEPGDRV